MTEPPLAPPVRRRPGAVRSLTWAPIYLVPAAILLALDRPAITKPRWSDEWATWLFSGQSWGRLWQATSHVDRDLLPYYGLVHLLRGVGADITAVRLLSLALGVVAVVASQLVARHIWGRVAALVTGLALVGNPFFCLWVTEARPTAIAYAVVAVTTLLVVRWSRCSAVAYPVLITVGTLLFPPTALAVGPHLFWRWRAAGRRAALRLALPTGAGVIAVAAFELLWIEQIPALVVASEYGVDNVLGALSHPLGAKRGLPWLHAAAVIGALAVLVARRHSGAVARRGIAMALLLVEGTVAVQWLATALGVPMLADNLLACVPMGAALLLGGLVGHSWFASRNPDADLSAAFRGGFAAAAAVSLTLAGAWWASNAASDISADRMEVVAPWLADQARVGDVVVFQQPYFSVGYTYSLAAAMGDRDLQATLRDHLPDGARSAVVRRVATVDAERSRVTTVEALPARTATRVWVVHLPADPINRIYRSALTCGDPQQSQIPVLLVYLDLYTCPA